VNPLLTWIEVATILRINAAANDGEERQRKRTVMRIMREAGAVDLGRSEWRVSQENLERWLQRRSTGSTNVGASIGRRATR
jgi:hypothetical protein